MGRKRKRVFVDVVREGKKGGLARAKKLSPAQRSEIARRAANVRWAKEKGKPPEL